jgi:hypothetical protein
MLQSLSEAAAAATTAAAPRQVKREFCILTSYRIFSRDTSRDDVIKKII